MATGTDTGLNSRRRIQVFACRIAGYSRPERVRLNPVADRRGTQVSQGKLPLQGEIEDPLLSVNDETPIIRRNPNRGVSQKPHPRRWMVRGAAWFVVSILGTAGCTDSSQNPRASGDEGERIVASPGDLRELRQRPLRLPKNSPSQPCELERHAIHIAGVPAEAALGKGPVRLVFRAVPRILDLFRPEENAAFKGSKWRGAEVLFVSEQDYDGPVFMRGGQIDGKHKIGFGTREAPEWKLLLPEGPWEVVDELSVWAGRRLQLPVGWRAQRATIRIRADGCYAIQLDGEEFSQVIEFGAVLQPGSI